MVSKAKPAKNRGPIILMYHGTTVDEPTSPYSLRADRFARHLAFMRRKGWNTARVKDLADPGSLPSRTLIITFDDGYADNFEGAFKPIVENGMVATWFIATDAMGNYASWMGNRSPEYAMLTTSQLREMAGAGMEIGSHTCSHPDLSRLEFASQLEEVSRSKEILESLLGQPVNSFAYPFGKFNEASLKAVEEAGYNHACSTRPGWFGSEANPLRLRRVTIFSHDTVAILRKKLEFADNDVSMAKMARYYGKRLLSRLS